MFTWFGNINVQKYKKKTVLLGVDFQTKKNKKKVKLRFSLENSDGSSQC